MGKKIDTEIKLKFEKYKKYIENEVDLKKVKFVKSFFKTRMN